jgi:hypothetical protein
MNGMHQAPVLAPIAGEDGESDDVDEELLAEGAERRVELGFAVDVRRQPHVKNEQGHRDGEDAITEKEQAILPVDEHIPARRRALRRRLSLVRWSALGGALLGGDAGAMVYRRHGRASSRS